MQWTGFSIVLVIVDGYIQDYFSAKLEDADISSSGRMNNAYSNRV